MPPTVPTFPSLFAPAVTSPPTTAPGGQPTLSSPPPLNGDESGPSFREALDRAGRKPSSNREEESDRVTARKGQPKAAEKQPARRARRPGRAARPHRHQAAEPAAGGDDEGHSAEATESARPGRPAPDGEGVPDDAPVEAGKPDPHRGAAPQAAHAGHTPAPTPTTADAARHTQARPAPPAGAERAPDGASGGAPRASARPTDPASSTIEKPGKEATSASSPDGAPPDPGISLDPASATGPDAGPVNPSATGLPGVTFPAGFGRSADTGAAGADSAGGNSGAVGGVTPTGGVPAAVAAAADDLADGSEDLAAVAADAGGDADPPAKSAKGSTDHPGPSPFANAFNAAADKARGPGPGPAAPVNRGDTPADPDPSPEAGFARANHARIISGVRGELLPGGGSMHLRLDPPELGDLQVSVHLRDGVMTASFHTSNDQATRLLSHSLGELKSMLEAQGVSVDKLHVQQGPRSPDAGGSRDPRDGARRDPASEQGHSDRREQQRRELIQKMWDRLAGKQPVDMVA